MDAIWLWWPTVADTALVMRFFVASDFNWLKIDPDFAAGCAGEAAISDGFRRPPSDWWLWCRRGRHHSGATK